ncbi:MAG: archease [Candidatus Omnitrophica bacterium]|nr:archease [Candidatus Omnitrophota bacterium]MDD5771250.1 archease [Candidatus Omnitrophota bacterium]
MKRVPYQPIEHTADIAIRIRSISLAGLFKKAALALTSLSLERQPFRYPQRHKIIIRQKASDTEELFVNWLNELISVSAAESLAFEDIKINHIDDKSIDAVATGSDIRNYKVNTEIKAATYHQLKIYKSGLIWQAEVIFDV